jgi:hypothetical protein
VSNNKPSPDPQLDASPRRQPLSLALNALCLQKQWVIWRREFRDKKPTKPPRQAKRPEYYASTNKPRTWSTADEAVAAAKAEQLRGPWGGIGFVLTDTDVIGFDLDKCVSDDGTIASWAMELVRRCNSYTEISPSGTGVHIVGLSESKRNSSALSPAGEHGRIEVYRNTRRFLTITGREISGGNGPLRVLDAIVDEMVANDISAPNYERAVAKAALQGQRALPQPRQSYRHPRHGEPLRQAGAGRVGPDNTTSGVFHKHVCQLAGRGWSVEEIEADMRAHSKNYQETKAAVFEAEGRLREEIERSYNKAKTGELFGMNEQHAVLPIGGKTRVATWGEDPEFPGYRTIVQFSSFDDFRALHDKYRRSYQKTDAKGNSKTVTVGLGSWWLAQPERCQYDGGMRFMPEHDESVVHETLNLWRGFGIVARKPAGTSGAAGCKLFLDHGLNVICSGNEEHFAYLMQREAFIAQRRTRSEVAVGLRTEVEGTGKGFWCRTLNHLYGAHAMQVQKPEHVIGKHNKHLEILLRLTADEALFALDPRHRNALYSLITEPTNTIEPKFVDSYSTKNYVNVDVISNAPHFLPVSGTARRFMVPSVSSERANDHEYFRLILAQLHDGGYGALLYHLLHEIDIRDFNVRAVPKTAALAEQASYSRKGIELLVEKACNEGRVPCQHTQWPGFSDCAGQDRGRGFDYFIDHHSDHELRRLGALAVKRKLKSEWGCLTGKATRRQIGRQKTFGILWPPLPELRARYEARFGKQKWLHLLLDEWQEAWDVT